jgi:uncharacterized protein (DUF2062 family)
LVVGLSPTERIAVASETKLPGLWERILVPVIVSAVMSGFTGYMGARTAIAVLESRVETLEHRQDQIKQQQDADGRTLVRIETKVDLLLKRTDQ